MNRRSQATGVTLIELLVAVSILFVLFVGGPGGAAFFAPRFVRDFLENSARTAERLAASSDAQSASTWFGDDVRSSEVVQRGAGQLLPCGPDNGVVTFWWTDPAPSADVDYTVTYLVVTAPDGGAELVRRVCEGSGAPTEYLVAQALAIGEVPPVEILCDPDSDCARAVTLRVNDLGGYSFELTGTRRVS